MFNIALVDISAEYGAALTAAQWVVTAYLLVISVLLPVMGRLGDLIGRSRIHNSGYFIFMLGALLCAFSPSLGWLIFFRVLQGIGASMYQATNMALIVSLFPPARRGRALGLMSTFVAAGSMVGPSLGGVLIQWFSWRANFWMLAAITALAWLMARRFVPVDKPEGTARLDVAGAAFFASSLTALVTALNLSATLGLDSLPVLLLLLLAACFMGLFIWWCLPSSRVRKAGRQPFIQLGLFRSSGVSTGILITIATYMAAFSAQLVLPVFLRNELGIQPATAGLILMAYPLALILSAPFFGRLSDKHGIFMILITGLEVMIATLVALGFLSAGYPLILLVVLIVLLGISMGMITSPNNSLVMRETPGEHLGVVSSILALSRNLGMMFGTVAGGGLMAAGFTGGSLTGYRSVFALCAALVFLSFLLMSVALRQKRRQETVSS